MFKVKKMAVRCFACCALILLAAPLPTYGQAVAPEHEIPIFTPTEPIPGSTIIPTDVVPLPTQAERASFGENLQLRILQKLPAKFYFNVTQEESIRTESNPFQYPMKRQFLRQLPAPPVFMNLPGLVQYSDLQSLSLSSDANLILRTLPNITAGWSLTPNTQILATYFLIRDAAFYNRKIDTTVQSIAGGIQHNFTITRNSSLQASWQFREFYETLEQPQFDMLPSLTYSYVLTPRTILYVNSLLQLRGKKYFQPATREIDPFYTAGIIYQKNGWSFSNTMTFVQNFRNIFRKSAFIPYNNYAIIGDFEIARRLYRSLPGLQAFARAEPIWNMASHNFPGLSGMDFRMYFGLRASAGKPPLTTALQQIREQLQEESNPQPQSPHNGKGNGKGQNNNPSTSSRSTSPYLYPYQLTASLPQPIHGYIGDQLLREALSSNAPINLSAVQGSLAAKSFVPVRHGRHIAYSHAAASRSVRGGHAGGSRSRSQSLSQSLPQSKLLSKSKSQSQLRHLKPATPPIHTTSPANIASGAKAHKRELAGNTSGKGKGKGISNTVSGSRATNSRSESGSQSNHLIAAKNKHKDIEMMLIPPLPPVNVQSRENPFAESGIDMKPPILINTAH